MSTLESVISMRDGDISAKTKCILWGKAAGCCEMCSMPVYEEWAHRQQGNFSNIAHIKAASPDGPRYDPAQTKEQRSAIDNLMLLCWNCHKLIDADPESYPADLLCELKKTREDNIARLLEGLRPQRYAVIQYLVQFGESRYELSEAEWKEALASRSIGYEGQKPFDMNKSGLDAKDASSIPHLAKELERRVRDFRECEYASGPIAVFALAPQPLLMKLGVLLGDEAELVIFQRCRSANGWCGSTTATHPSFKLKKPDIERAGAKRETKAVILLSISGAINKDSLPLEISHTQAPVYEIVCANEGVDAADSQEASEIFRSFAADAIYRIHQKYPEVNSLHIFPAMPVSLNVVFGAALNTNVIPEYVVYEKRGGKFSESLVIGGTK